MTSVTLLSIVVVSSVVGPLHHAGLPRVAPPSLDAAPDRPCRPTAWPPWSSEPLTDAELALLARHRWPGFQARLRREPLPHTARALQDHVDAAFEPTYARIPEFLDWHYSIAGQYTQLGQAVLGQLEDSQLARAAFERLQRSQLARAIRERLGQSELAQRTLDGLGGSELVQAALDQLRQGVDVRLFGDLPDRVRQASVDVEGVLREEMRILVERRIRDEVQTLAPHVRPASAAPCPEREASRMGMAYEDMLRAAIPQTLRRFTNTAAPTGIVAAGAALPGAAAAGALVRGLSRRVFARTASRTARAIGAAAGGLAAGAAAWLLVDTAVLFVDEHFNREELERELTALVDEQKAAIESALSQAVSEAKSEALGELTPSELGSRGEFGPATGPKR